MRPWTIPILGVVVLSLAAPSSADARPRFGLLGAMAAPFAMFGGARHSYRHHRRGAVRPSLANRGEAQAERGAMAGALAPPAAAAVFWPDAPADLANYLFFPKGKGDRFWIYGYGAIVEAAFATSDIDDAIMMRSRRVA